MAELEPMLEDAPAPPVGADEDPMDEEAGAEDEPPAAADDELDELDDELLELFPPEVELPQAASVSASSAAPAIALRLRD